MTAFHCLLQTSAIIFWKMLQRRIVWKTLLEIPWEMQCRLLFTKVFPWRTNTAVRPWAGGRLEKRRCKQVNTHLSVEAGSWLEEQFAELVHAVGVASGVFKAREESTAYSHSFIQAFGHFSCKNTFKQECCFPKIMFHLQLAFCFKRKSAC